MAAATTAHLILCTLLAAAALCASQAPTVAPGPAAPAPPNNLTAVLEKSGQYKTFIRLLRDSRVDTQINSQLNNSYTGLTVFAPDDAAFASLKAGALNSLTEQEQIEVVLFHVLPRFYTLATFATVSNPLNTQASSGKGGPDKLNVTSTSSAVNVSTGVDWATVSGKLSTDFPLAVYSVGKVLLPYSLFGAKPPAPAPAPAPHRAHRNSSSGIAEPPAAASADSKKSAAAGVAVARWSWATVGAGAAVGVLGGFF